VSIIHYLLYIFRDVFIGRIPRLGVAIFTDVVGYSATVIGTALMLPQLHKSWKTRKVADLSFGMLVLYFFNCFLWGLYGLLIGATPLIITNGIALLISVLLLILKIRYG
jgi:MtN3 and saliva related transmembrane protein